MALTGSYFLNQNGTLAAKKTGADFLSPAAVARMNYERRQNAIAAAEADKDRGGLFGGLGYVGEKFAVGLVSSLEGIVDYTSAGVAKLFGADVWA